MSTLSIRIPDSIHESVKRISRDDHVSINQFIASAITEKITAMDTEIYLMKRGQSGSRESFLKVLDRVSDQEPEDYDH
jgi:hypothetical protein